MNNLSLSLSISSFKQTVSEMKSAISSFNSIKEEIKSIPSPEFKLPELTKEQDEKDSFESLISELKNNLEESTVLQDKVKPV